MLTLKVQRTRPIIRQIALGLLTFLLTASCGINSFQHGNQANGLNTADTASSNCRIVQHAVGKTCVPLNPQRVVTLDPFSLENVLALGVQPVGFAISPDWLEKREYLRVRLSGIENAGDHSQPSLEKILALKPDLILGLELNSKAAYRQLTQIAPTVLLNFKTSGQWKEILMQNADALGKTDVANELMANYYARLNDFKAQLGNNLQQLEVSIVRIYLNTISIYTSDTFIGSIIKDAGLTRPPTQTQTGTLDISKESLHLADGDVIFLWSNETGQVQQDVKAEIAKLRTDPLWKKLKGVQHNRVYEVPSYWIGSSILTAHAVIDDLFKYLVDEAS